MGMRIRERKQKGCVGVFELVERDDGVARVSPLDGEVCHPRA